MYSYFRMAVSLAERYGLKNDPRIASILRMLSVLGNGEDARDLYDYLVLKMKEQIVDPNPFLPHPSAEAIAGDVPIGVTETGALAGINLAELGQGGIGIFGRTGSGKTVTAANISCALAKKYPDRVALWFFETMKKTFRHVMPGDTLVIPFPSDRFNAWREPPGADYQQYQMGVVEITAQYAGVQQAGVSMLWEGIQELDEIYGVHKGSGIRPTMLEVHKILLMKREKYLKNKDTSKVGYIDRLTGKMLPFVSFLKDVVGVDRGFPLEEIMERNCIWELTGLSSPLQSWFINAKLFWKIQYKKANPAKAKKLCVNVFDEAWKVFGRDLQED